MGPLKTNPSSGWEEDLNLGPLDYKSSTLPLGHAHLPIYMYIIKGNLCFDFAIMIVQCSIH